jgi:hypothetical protein
MNPISVQNLNQGNDSPKFARQDLLEVTQRVNLVTADLEIPASPSPITWDRSLSITGDLTVNGAIVGNAATATKFRNPITFTVGGDLSGSASLDGSENVSLNLTLPPSGVAPGTYGSSTEVVPFSVNSKGQVIGVGLPQTITPAWANIQNKPTTLSGFGLVSGEGTLGQVFTSSGPGQTPQWTTLPTQGGGGSSGPSTIYGTTHRYQTNPTAGFGATMVSSSSMKTGLSWTRSGVNLTITDPGHGRSVGERAIVRNANASYIPNLITAVTTDTFTVTTTDTGDLSGTAAAYGMGFTYSLVGAVGAITACIVSAPANWDVVLLSIRVHLAANSRAGTTFQITVPKGFINGAGPHTSMDDLTIPHQNVRQDNNNLQAVGATIGTFVNGDYATYQFAALGLVAIGIHIIMIF